jgi:hypothetical protein
MLAMICSIVLVVGLAAPGSALKPAKTPRWDTGNYWNYEGALWFVEIDNRLDVSGEQGIKVDNRVYNVFVLDSVMTFKTGAISSTITGKDFYTTNSYELVKSERYTKEKGEVKTTTITYEPPLTLIDFPLEMGKLWRTSVNEHKVETVGSVTATSDATVNTTYEVVGIDSVNTTAGIHESFRIKASNETGAYLNYWYSEEVGNYVKLDLAPELGFDTDMKLVSTNYKPPKKEDNGPSVMANMALIPIALVIVLLIAAVVMGYYLHRKKMREQPAYYENAPVAVPVAQPVSTPPQPATGVIEDVFLIARDGRLIHHDARRLKPEMDQDLMSGMFTAIQEFISQSFRSADGSRSVIKEIKYQDNKILLEQGQMIYLAVVTDTIDTSNIQDRMSRIVRLIETKCAGELQHWDGNVDSVIEAKRLARFMLSDEQIPDQ